MLCYSGIIKHVLIQKKKLKKYTGLMWKHKQIFEKKITLGTNKKLYVKKISLGYKK